MRIIFNPSETRRFERNKTLSGKPLIIADNVNPTDDVELIFGDDYISLEKTGNDDEVTMDTEWLYIGKAFGLYGEDKNLSSVIEVLICDEYLAVKLVKGAITVHPDESKPDDVILVASGVDESTLPAPYLNKIKWVDRDYFASLCKYWGDFADKHPADYYYTCLVAGEGGDYGGINFRKMSILDISYGALALKKEEIEEKERKKKVSAATALFSVGSSEPKFETFDSDTDDDGDDDDDMYDY